MKKVLLGLSIVLAMAACKKEEPRDFTIISGNILNSNSKTLKITGLNDSFSETISLTEAGDFKDTLNINQGHYMIYDGKNVSYLFLQLGFDVKMDYDSNDYKNTLKFSGIGSEINNYLIAKRNKEREIIGENKNVYELNETDFTAKQKEIKAGLLKLLSSTENFPSNYLEKEEKNINYSYLSKLDIYESYHQYYAKVPDFKISEGFLNELKALDFNNEEDFKFSTSYENLIRNHYNKEAVKLSNSDSIDNDVALIRVLNSLTNKTIKNKLLFDSAKFGITYTSDLEDYYNSFMNASTNPEHKKEISDSYKALKKVSKGELSPEFVNYENNSGGTTSLVDLKGKYVYVDVWATWCGPCKAEIPYLKKIEELYHGKNIAFVSISVDKTKDRDKWKKMIVDEDLGGIQLLADNDFNSKFVQDYFIKGIPRFILIDPNGIILDSNAPRPSAEALVSLFKTLEI